MISKLNYNKKFNNIMICKYINVLFNLILFYILDYEYKVFIFFFLSRRRHTRCYRDWSSDVRSSDLQHHTSPERQRRDHATVPALALRACVLTEDGRTWTMLSPFFTLAAVSPGRQRTFRSLVAAHLVILACGVALLFTYREHGRPLLGHVLLIAGIVEGALLIGWRLTQLPKSQALEFLLVSPVRPRQLFLAEALVGLTRLALVTLAGLPVLLLLAGEGLLDFLDLPPLFVMPLTLGAVAGF